MTAKTMHQSEAELRAALATLAERYRNFRSASPDTKFLYSTVARDIDDVLRTSRIPHDLMTDAELEEHGPRKDGAQ